MERCTASADGKFGRTARVNTISTAEISAAQDILSPIMVETPTLPLTSDRWRAVLPHIAEGSLKLELFQQVGSFKARGAYLGIHALSQQQRKAGVIAASGGNHALAVAWAAQKLGIPAKIAIPEATDPMRINGCRTMGADVILCEDIAHAFDVMEQGVAQDGQTMIHPFEGRNMTIGAATCGAEFLSQYPDLEVIIVPVGGGGLIGGIGAAVKLMKPDVEVIGVEPAGADTMYRSLKKGEPVRISKVETCADSLAAPTAMPYSFGIAQTYVDEIVHVEDDELLNGMRIYQDVLGLTVEPACAASLAGAIGPLRQATTGRRVGLIACGSNIGLTRYQKLLSSN